MRKVLKTACQMYPLVVGSCRLFGSRETLGHVDPGLADPGPAHPGWLASN